MDGFELPGINIFMTLFISFEFIVLIVDSLFLIYTNSTSFFLVRKCQTLHSC
jgi:hypothetical protein